MNIKQIEKDEDKPKQDGYLIYPEPIQKSRRAQKKKKKKNGEA